MKKNQIIVTDGFDAQLFSELKSIPEFDVAPKSKYSLSELQEFFPTVESFIIRSNTTVNKELIDQCPNLKYVIRAGEGTDNIDKSYCQAKGIKVSNTPGANNNSAAEHAIALMLTTLRKTAWAHNSMANGEWEKSKFTGFELTNKKIGIIGFGRIGQLVAKRLQGFEPSILFYDPFITESPISYATKCDDLATIFKTCDIITIHLPLTDKTKNLITKDLLDLMPQTSILINAARGKIVNEQDLYATLKEGKILGAGFDVFEEEPLSTTSPLRTLPNIVLTPHLGGSTEEAQFRVGEMAVHQLKEFFIHNNLLNEVIR